MSVVIRVPSSVSYTNGSIAMVSGSAYFAMGPFLLSWHNAAANGARRMLRNIVLELLRASGQQSNLITVTMVIRWASSARTTSPWCWTPLPAVIILTPPSGALMGSGNVTVEWSGSDLSGMAYYHVSVDGGTPVNLTGLTHTFTGLQDGMHIVNVTGYDLAGNRGSASVNVTVDIPPEVSVEAPSEGQALGDWNVTVTWQVDDAGAGISRISVSVDGEARPNCRPTPPVCW